MNNFKYLLVLPILLSTLFLSGQKKESVFIDFDDEKITKEEFKRVYLKNNSGEIITKSSVEEYLELYLNFKLKVKEAEARGMDTISSFVSELAGYRKQLAQPYLTADGIIEDLKQEAYERLKQDVKASHILIAVSEEASQADTLKAFNKAKNIKKQLEKGEDFEKLAKLHSDDPSAKTNGGNLGYFTAFYMVYPFESAAYKTKKGEVSDVIRTQFGYHVLKVTDKREAVGNIKVAHILISSDAELSKTDDPEGKIREIYKKIQDGATFEEMAAQFSDDSRTSSNGGELPTFGVGRMVPEFEKAAFSLKKDGDITEPIQTPYGWHIIKRLRKDPIGTFKEVEKEIVQRIKKDSRSNLSQSAVINKIKKQYGFSENLKAKAAFYDVLDSSYFEGNWDVSKASKLTKPLFTIGDKKVTQQDFANFLNKSQRKRKAIDESVIVDSRYLTFKKNQILKYKDSKLDEEYPEFKLLMEEYHDGILLFNLTDELVWSKAIKDSSGLENYLETNKEKYKWGKRVDAVVYSALDERIVKDAKKMIKAGKSPSDLIEEINKTSQLNLNYEKKLYQKGDNEIIDQVNWKKGTSDNISSKGRIYFVVINEVLEASYKSLEDSRGLITSDYQNYLEKEWIKSLRSKYSFEVDKKVLNELKTELK